MKIMNENTAFYIQAIWENMNFACELNKICKCQSNLMTNNPHYEDGKIIQQMQIHLHASATHTWWYAKDVQS